MSRILLTTITLFLVSQPLSAQEESSSIYNARSLVNREWACSYTATQKDYNSKSTQHAGRYTTNYQPSNYPTYQSSSSTILSLKPGDSWGEGKAWILKVTDNGSNQNQIKYEAWKGFYYFYGDGDDEDNLILKIGFVRKYDGQKQQDRISWTLDTRYEKKGARIDIPLDEQTVPSNRISLSVIGGFFVDSKGRPTIRRYEPSGFLENLIGEGDIQDLYSTEFIELGKTIEMNDSSAATILVSTGLGESLPTGCKLHD